MKKLLFIFLLLLCAPVYAQQFDSNTTSQQSGGVNDYISGSKKASSKNNIFILNDFSGGLNTKLSPIDLDKSQSDIAQNVRYDTQLKALTKRDKTLVYGTASATNPILGLHRFYLSNGTKVLLTDYSNTIATGNDTTGAFTSIFSLPQGSRRAQWLTWHNIAIMTDGFNEPVKYDGTSGSATYLGALLATDSGSGSGITGTYTYKVSCYTTDFELSLGNPSNTIVMGGHTVNLSMIPICTPTFLGETVIGRHIYRTGAGDSTYKLITGGTIDNVITTLTDSTADGSRTTLLAPTTISAPPMGRLSIIHDNRLWIANDPNHPSRIYYSEDSSHDVFLPTSFLDIRQNDGDEITFAQNVLGVLTIGKTNSIQKVYTTGDPSTDWAISDPFSFVGCAAMYTAKNTPLGLVYLSNNGIYLFDGQYSTLLSDAVTPEIKDISSSNIATTCGEYYKNGYYLSYTSSKSGATSNNRVLVVDLLTKAFSIDTSSMNVFTVFRSGTDVEILYGGGSSNGKVYSYSDSIRQIISRRNSDFTGTFTNAAIISADAGGDPESPIIDLERIGSIDSLVGTIDSLTGTIDRSSLTGNYVSQPFDIGATHFDKIYWNETLPTAGSNVTLSVRSATSDSAISYASFSPEYSDPSGSDISANAANKVVQYRISLTTDNLALSPTVYKANNFVIRLDYEIASPTDELTIPLEWRSGWMDFGAPAYKKTLRKIQVDYDSAGTGTLNVNFSNYGGDIANFPINLTNNPSEYIEYFPNGMFLGELFKMDIIESSLNALKIKRILITYDIEPLI